MIDVGIIRIAAYLGAGIAVGSASISTGIGSGLIAGEASYAIMRQPKISDKLFRTMLIGQAATGTGGILSLVVALLLLFGGFDVAEGGFYRVAIVFAAGISVGIGAIGPAYGAGYSGAGACKALGRMPSKESTIVGNMLIGQALAQSGSIFALLVSLLLLYSTPLQPADISMPMVILKGAAYIGAGTAIGFGTIGPGIGIGYAAGEANDMVGRFPRQSLQTIKTMFLGSAVAQSTAIYSLIVAFLLIFAF